MSKYKAQVEVRLRFTAFVEVEGDFKSEYDERIDNKARELASLMSPDHMAFEDEETEVIDVIKIEE